MESENPSVQPEGSPEGQGAEDSGGFYQEYLDTVPEDYRPHVEPYLKDVESNTNSKFREHADYRSQWEPYEELGITDYDPEALGQWLQFSEIFNDPETFQEWWKAAGEQNGWMNSDDEDDDDVDDDDEDEPDMRQMLEGILDERLSPLMEKEFNREQKERMQSANNFIDAELDELAGEYDLDEEDQMAVLRFSLPYSDDNDPEFIKKGFQDFEEYRAKIERGTVTRKVNGPNRPERGDGPANTNAQPVTDFAEAKELAKERFAQLSR